MNMASAMNVSETMVIDIALSNLASEVLPCYEMDGVVTTDSKHNLPIVELRLHIYQE